MKHTRLRNVRPKAAFGAEAAATLAAAAMTTAATYASARQQAAATREGADRQARQIQEQARVQANALDAQNKNNTDLQTRAIESQKEIAERERDMMRDIQMNLQLATAKENMDNRLEASKMVVANGGRVRIRRGAKPARTLLRGGFMDNLGFRLTGQGNVQHVMVTPEGYDLYSIYGPSHDNGGVDIDFDNGAKVEAEGDRAKTGRNRRRAKLGGEYLLTTPNDAFFISQHDIDGFNPAEAVDHGMNPVTAYQIQEYKKAINHIPDDGGKAKHGGSSRPVGKYVARLRNGGRIKARNGSSTYLDALDDLELTGTYLADPRIYKNSATDNNSGTTSTPKSSFDWGGLGVNLGAAGITALGNIAGGLVTSRANNYAANRIGEANAYRSQVLGDAYRNLKTIDPNIVTSSDFAVQHYMPTIRSARVNVNPQMATIERSLGRQRDSILRGSASSAAALSRLNSAEANATDLRNKVYGEQVNAEEKIKQENAKAITEAAQMNAIFDNQAQKYLSDTRFQIAKYNNDIVNQGILGAAGVEAESAMDTAKTDAQMRIGNAGVWGGILGTTGKQLGDVISNQLVYNRDKNNILAGSGLEAQVIAAANSNDTYQKTRLRNMIQKAINNNSIKGEARNHYIGLMSMLS